MSELEVTFASTAVLLEQERHLQQGGLFLPTPQPAPEASAAITVHLHTPVGDVLDLTGTVVQLFGPNGMAITLDDAAAAAAALGPLLDAARAQPVGDGAVTVAWASAGSGPEEEEDSQTLYDRIKAMGTSQKRQLALKGGRAERLFLMKDMNKTLQTFLLKNPRITIDEVKSLATNRQASADALKMISENRTWVQNQSVVGALVRNPRTPSTIAVRLMEKLPKNEIRALAKSSSVPRAVSQAAKRKVLGKG